MTEEIIIDGVNVAGCEFYFKDEKYSCDLSFINQEELCKCDDVQDCTYKQLKRLEQENEKQKEYIKDLQARKDRYYLQVLEYERQVNDWISFYIKVRDIVAGNYEMLESQGLQDLRRIINEVEE